jgi:ATP-dependent helicase HrpB
LSAVLPIDAHLSEIVRSLERAPNLVLVAEPGAGKTTRVPPALLRSAFMQAGQLLVLEPRRIAARMAARRVASELGESVGKTCGYIVRFERQVSRETRIVFLTEALLTRRLIEDPRLRGVSAVILDELHERSLHTDMALALLRRLQQRERPDLRIIAMSATLDAERVATFLASDVMRVSGRAFPVEIEHLERPDERKLEEQVAVALRKLCLRGLLGDVLVFLPGAAEIRRAEESCAAIAASFELSLCMLHGDLPPAEQDRAVANSTQRKLILSTNIAESSLTIEGVAHVIDSGLARVAGHSPWSGLATLSTAKVSQASATQRAGRAGRVREGTCLRLYTKHDHDARPRFDTPEIVKSDLAEALLFVRSILGASDETLDWLDAPPKAAAEAAHTLLLRLGALESTGALTALGTRLLAMPAHPRIGRFVVAAAERGFHEEGATIAALLGERDVRLSARQSFAGARRGKAAHDDVGTSDLLARFEAFDALGSDFSAQNCRRHELDFQQVRSAARSRDAFLNAIRNVERKHDGEDFETAIRLATLFAFPDRVGRRRNANKRDFVLSGGGSAELSEASVVKEAEFIVAVEADERGKSAAVIRAASAIEAEWLLEHFADFVREAKTVRFAAESERVETSEQIAYDALVLDETRSGRATGPEVSACLAEAARRLAAAAPWDVDSVEQYRLRTIFAHQHDVRVTPLDEEHLLEALRAHCAGKTSFAELRAEPFERVLPQLLEPQVRALVDKLAPAALRLPSGRELRIRYEADRPPWVQSRLQDFFGLRDGPRVADGKVAVVLHLLAPNQRPVQVSTDLSGFWARHYAGIRKELMRRYPRHSWPEDPLTAEPPSPHKRR